MQNNRFIDYLKLFFTSLHPKRILIIQTNAANLWPAYQDRDKSVFYKVL